MGWRLCLDVVSPPRAGPRFQRADAVVTSQGSVEARGASFEPLLGREGALSAPSGRPAAPAQGGWPLYL